MNNYSDYVIVYECNSGIDDGFDVYCVYSSALYIGSLCRSLNDIKDREICCYSVSCKERENIGKSRLC